MTWHGIQDQWEQIEKFIIENPDQLTKYWNKGISKEQLGVVLNLEENITPLFFGRA